MKKISICIPIILLGVCCTHVLKAQKNNIKSTHSGGAEKVVLSGKIKDAKNGDLLEGASIYFPDLKIGSTSNAQGEYRIQNIPEGKYLLEVSYLGYASILESIELDGNIQKDFLLNPSFIESEGVTVTGVSAATSIRRTSIPVNILKREDLFRGVSTNLIDGLTKTPGVSQISTGPAISKPSIRGLGYNRVVVVNDGIRQEGQQWGDEHGIEIDEYNVSKAEVLKGPASLMYGSDALAGVVNFISIIPAPQGTVKGNLFATYQSNNRQRGFHADLGGNKNGFIWGAYGSYKAAGDYKNKYDGYVFNSKFNERDFGGYLGMNKNWGFSHFYLSKFDQHVGLVEGDRDDATGKFIKQVNNNGIVSEEISSDDDSKSTDPFIPRQIIKHFKIATDNSFNLGKNRFTLTLGYQRNQRQEYANILEPSEKGLFFDLNTINYNLQYHLLEKREWKTTIGVNGMVQTNKNKGIEVLIPEYSLFDIGTFLYTQKTFEKMTLSGGIRFDNRSINSKEFIDAGDLKFQQFKKSFSNISGSAGLSYEASSTTTLKFNIARGFRSPSIPELASNGAHEGTNRFEYGEQNLKSETSLQVDGGIVVNTEHISLSANAFYNSIQNFIYYRKLISASGGDSVVDRGTEQFFAFRFDQNNAKLYGMEANLDIHPHPLDWLHIENSFSVVKGVLNKEQDGSKYLPFVPAARLIDEIKADFFKKGKTIRDLYLKVELDNTFSQNHPFTGFNTETKTPGYSLLNAGFGGDIVSNGKKLFSLYFGANNIGDVAYQNHLSRLKYAPINEVTGRQGVFNMGRNFSMKVNVPLTFNLN